jgi:hypothetical protein
MKALPVLTSCALVLLVQGCAASAVRSANGQPEAGPAQTAPATSPTTEETVDESEIFTVSLAVDEVKEVPGTPLVIRISSSFHKVQAPLVGVSVLVSVEGEKAEISWRIEHGQIDASWQALEGRYYDDDADAYVEGRVPGWRVRLESVDDRKAGGSPSAITVSFQRAN